MAISSLGSARKAFGALFFLASIAPRPVLGEEPEPPSDEDEVVECVCPGVGQGTACEAACLKAGTGDSRGNTNQIGDALDVEAEEVIETMQNGTQLTQ